MKDTYERAYHVIVLDNELEMCSRDDQTEAFMRIYLSAWMRRLWTLQEGVLGRRLFVKFSDGFLDLKAEYSKTRARVDPNNFLRQIREAHGTPREDAHRFYWKLRLMRAQIVEKPERKLVEIKKTIVFDDPEAQARAKLCSAIMEAFIASRYRSTSRQEDEFVCLASLLGWNTSGLRSFPIDQRMRVLLEGESMLPQGLLFVAGPRMRESGWRWATTRFGTSGVKQLNASIHDNTPGTRNEQGFTVQFPGLVLPSTCLFREFPDLLVSFSDESGQQRWVRVVREDGQQVEKGQKTSSEIHSGSATTEIRETAQNSDFAASQRSFCVLFHDLSHCMALGLCMAAALVSVHPDHFPVIFKSEEDLCCRFEDLAQLEVIEGGRDEAMLILQRSGSKAVLTDERAQLTRRKWCVQ